jgi:chaperonin GroEL
MKKFQNKQDLSNSIAEAVQTLAENVQTTLGPRGRNVILHKAGALPIITKDGVTISEFVEFEDPFQNSAAQIVKQAARKTAQNAGDGTTTTTVLANAIYQQARRHVLAGAAPVEIKRGLDKVAKLVIEELDKVKSPVNDLEDVRHIATISANNDEVIGSIVATAVDKAGNDGSVQIEEARAVDTTVDILEGFRFDAGFVSPSFITDERAGTCNYENALILVADEKIDTVEQIFPILEVVAREGRPLVIIADQIEGQALAALIMNSQRGTMKVAAVKAPRYGEERKNTLKDLAVATGATFASVDSGVLVKDLKLKDLGLCKSINVGRLQTIVVGGKGDLTNVQERIEALKTEISSCDDMVLCERIQERITRLASGVAVIRVGASTEVEMIEKKHRIEDALEAVNSAQAEGILAGGGSALLRIGKSLSYKDWGEVMEHADQRVAVSIMREAFKAPLQVMCINAGESFDLISQQLYEDNVVWDFTKEEVVDAFEAGILDPVRVTKNAVLNAVSVAGTLITTDYAIVEG